MLLESQANSKFMIRSRTMFKPRKELYLQVSYSKIPILELVRFPLKERVTLLEGPVLLSKTLI